MSNSNQFSLKQINNILQGQTRHLDFVLTKIKYLSELNKKIIAYIEPATLREYCQVANLNKNKLVLLVANSSVATQLKFQTQQLLNQFKQDQDLRIIHDVQIKLQAYHALQSQSHSVKPHEMPYLSQKTAEIVHGIAQSLQDPTLRAIMERIATRVKEN